MRAPIRVGIAEDHAITRYALVRHIGMQDDMVVAGEAGNGAEAVQLARSVEMDVLVLDLMMPGTGALDVVRTILARAPRLALLVFTNFPGERYALNVLRLGASGFLSKQCQPDEITLAIRTLAQGRRYVRGEVAELLATQAAGTALRPPHEMLTRREFQLMLHFARGESSAEIARKLSLSPNSVSTYRSTLLKKMEVKTASELTHYALVHGLLD
ncbi:response regulator [Caenimonas aquaedulcis]|uniref:Response regulator transcription factor n=1 Tax=Caenimonas aquaedulcis TaxID=2793270 RepID=A0A931H2Y9_9BURK|nr:response regulator transcription factor [Caenimonas aquaedulcis]MBG9387607.1 response regulator transcription factor [Caenimonas aquaedulcis]